MADTVVKNAQNIWDKAPKEVKEGGKCFLAAAAQAASALTLHEAEIKPLSQLCANMRNGVCINASQANQMLDMCEHAFVSENRTEIFQSLTTPSSCNQAVVQQMEKVMRSTANKFLLIGAVSSFFFVVVEFVRLWNFWEAIKDARNITEASAKQRVEITETLKRIAAEINTLNAFVGEILRGKSEEIIRVRAMRQIDRIRRMLDDAQRKIRDLEVEVDRKKVRLIDARRSGKISAMTNLVSGGTTAFSVFLFSAMANPFLIGLNATLAVANGLMAAGNIATCVISSKDLENIEAELRLIAEVEKFRQELDDKLQNKAEELYDLLEDRV